jgi:hypothetical protein
MHELWTHFDVCVSGQYKRVNFHNIGLRWAILFCSAFLPRKCRVKTRSLDVLRDFINTTCVLPNSLARASFSLIVFLAFDFYFRFEEWSIMGEQRPLFCFYSCFCGLKYRKRNEERRICVEYWKWLQAPVVQSRFYSLSSFCDAVIYSSTVF